MQNDRSRLSTRMKRKTEKSLFLSIIGIIIVVFLLIKFGIPLLFNLSLFISTARGGDEVIQAKTSEFVAPPLLDPTFQATNSATITLSGTAGEKQTIKLYKNNDYISDTTTEKKGLFVFEDI